MPDILSVRERSERMSRIHSRGNRNTELALARLFRVNGICGWRRRRNLLGKPDFTFHKQRVVVFVNGCFWHACPQHGHYPKGNKAFWRKKLLANIARDRFVNRQLRKAGWHVLRIWEHELIKSRERCVQRIRRALRE